MSDLQGTSLVPNIIEEDFGLRTSDFGTSAHGYSLFILHFSLNFVHPHRNRFANKEIHIYTLGQIHRHTLQQSPLNR